MMSSVFWGSCIKMGLNDCTWSFEGIKEDAHMKLVLVCASYDEGSIKRCKTNGKG